MRSHRYQPPEQTAMCTVPHIANVQPLDVLMQELCKQLLFSLTANISMVWISRIAHVCLISKALRRWPRAGWIEHKNSMTPWQTLKFEVFISMKQRGRTPQYLYIPTQLRLYWSVDIANLIYTKVWTSLLSCSRSLTQYSRCNHRNSRADCFSQLFCCSST